MTVYRLITAGTIEERVQQRARRKHAIQRAVIEGEARHQQHMVEEQAEDASIEECGDGAEIVGDEEELAALLLDQ